MSVSYIETIFIGVADLEQAKNWYLPVIGAPQYCSDQIAVYETGETLFVLSVQKEGSERPVVNFQGKELEKLWQHLLALGYEVNDLKNYEDFKTFELTDPFGNRLGFINHQ